MRYSSVFYERVSGLILFVYFSVYDVPKQFDVRKGGGVKPGFSGGLYQIKLQMLALIQGLHKKYMYGFASEMDGLGSLDDILVEHGGNNWILIQAKHSITGQRKVKPIKLSDLLPPQKKDKTEGPFAVQKYFVSYLECRRTAEHKGKQLESVVIFSNSGFDFKSETNHTLYSHKKLTHKKLTSITFKELEESEKTTKLKNLFLVKKQRGQSKSLSNSTTAGLKSSGSSEYFGKLYKFSTGRDKGEVLIKQLLELNPKTIPPKSECGKIYATLSPWMKEKGAKAMKEMKMQFLEDLVFAVNQPPVDELDKFIIEELSKEIDLEDKLEAGKIVYKDLLDQMLKYFEKMSDKEEYKTEELVQEFLNNSQDTISRVILTERSGINRKKLIKSGIEFPEGPLPKFPCNDQGNPLFPGDTKLTIIDTKEVTAVAMYVDHKLRMNVYGNNIQKCLLFSFTELREMHENSAALKKVIESSGNAALVLFECKKAQVTKMICFIKLILELRKSSLKVFAVVDYANKNQQDFQETCSIKMDPKYLSERALDNILKKDVRFQGISTRMKDLLERSDLRDVIDAEVIEKLVRRENVSIESELPPKDAIYVNRTFIDVEWGQTDLPTRKEDSFQEFKMMTNSIGNHKNVVVFAPPGFGKSTTLRSVAVKIKNKYLKYWVLPCDLLSCRNMLFREKNKKSFTADDQNSTLEFFIKLVLKTPTEFTKNLLRYAYKHSGKIVALFDGFDEISPDYKCIVIDLLDGLIKSKKVMVWVSSRPHMEEALQEKLGSELAPYAMLPLSKTEQVKLLKVLINSRPDKGKQDTRLVEKLRQLQAWDQFFGNPLHLTMAADALQATDEESENLSLHSLYEKCVEKKFEVYLKEKRMIDHTIPDNRLANESAVKKLTDDLKRVARQVVMYKEIASENEVDFSVGQLQNLGLISGNNFVHRTFAEFFFSMYLFELIERNSLNELGTEVFKVFQSRDFRDVRGFLELRFRHVRKEFLVENVTSVANWPDRNQETAQYVENNKSRTFLSTCVREGATKLSKYLWNYRNMLDKDEWVCLFFDAALAKNYEILRIILSREFPTQVKAVKKVPTREGKKKAKMAEQDEAVVRGKTALHFAVSKNGELNSLLEQLSPENNDMELTVELLIDKKCNVTATTNMGKHSLIRTFFGTRSDSIPMKEFWNTILPGSTKEAHNVNALHIASACGSKEVCKLLIENGCHASAATAEGVKPINIAKLFNNNEIVTLLNEN